MWSQRIYNLLRKRLIVYLCHKWPHICSVFRNHNPVISSFTTYHRACNKSNMTGATCGVGTMYPSGPPEFNSGFKWSSCYSIFSFMCMFCRSSFVPLYFFFWPLCCLSVCDLRLPSTPVVSWHKITNDNTLINYYCCKIKIHIQSKGLQPLLLHCSKSV